MNISNNSDSTAKNQIALENQLKSQENIFKEIISKIKEDYENIISKKDLEVKAYVSQLADENSKLKADNQIQKEKNVLLTNKLDVIKQTYSSLALVNNKEENNPKNKGRSLLKIEEKSKYPAKLVNTSFPSINKITDPKERNNENIENNIIKTAFFFALKQDI